MDATNKKARSGIKETVPKDDQVFNYIPATNHATTYQSTLTRLVPEPSELKRISHINCSYLSSNQAPTLLELKKHAQSLAILIRKLSIQTNFGVPDVGESGGANVADWKTLEFKQNEAFDWLSDLGTPYENPDGCHHLPLNSIQNEIAHEHDVEGATRHCPLPQADRATGSHMALLQHANECLEILDHEYSATGGLLSLLPSDDDGSDETKHARNTLIGQWLLFQHHLIGRMHELEIEYANACSALSHEAEIPKQIINKQTFEERQRGHDVAHLQDKFILVNAGTPAHNEIHHLLDEKEKHMEERARQWHDAGVQGQRLFTFDEDEDPLAEGIVKVDLVSRFYRVKGDGPEAAVFVLPAIEHQGSLQRTLDMERKPGVVSVPESKWPARVTDWERRYREKIYKADLETDWAATVEMLREENEALRKENQVLKMKEAGNYPTWGANTGF